MTTQEGNPKAPEVAVNKRTQGIANDPTAPAGAERGVVVIRHNETQGITSVPRSAYEGSYRYNGWEEVDVEGERDSLFEQARDMGVNVPETAGGREIVEAMKAYSRNNREV